MPLYPNFDGNLPFSLKVIRPALLLGPKLRIVRAGVQLKLDFVGVDNLLAAELALNYPRQGESIRSAD
jgi:hypothetical protein